MFAYVWLQNGLYYNTEYKSNVDLHLLYSTNNITTHYGCWMCIVILTAPTHTHTWSLLNYTGRFALYFTDIVSNYSELQHRITTNNTALDTPAIQSVLYMVPSQTSFQWLKLCSGHIGIRSTQNYSVL